MVLHFFNSLLYSNPIHAGMWLLQLITLVIHLLHVVNIDMFLALR